MCHNLSKVQNDNIDSYSSGGSLQARGHQAAETVGYDLALS